MKKYSGFTLIEMLIVMGIIIILMAAGIAGGRFALQRANRIQKQSAVDNIEQALWGYYSDNRNFPTSQSPEDLMTGELSDYVDAGQFDGGADGTFWYYVENRRQEFVVCTSLGGFDDDAGLGIYCAGNGLQTIAPFSQLTVAVTDNIYEPNAGYDSDYNQIKGGGNSSDWFGETRDWTGTP